MSYRRSISFTAHASIPAAFFGSTTTGREQVRQVVVLTHLDSLGVDQHESEPDRESRA